MNMDTRGVDTHTFIKFYLTYQRLVWHQWVRGNRLSCEGALAIPFFTGTMLHFISLFRFPSIPFQSGCVLTTALKLPFWCHQQPFSHSTPMLAFFFCPSFNLFLHIVYVSLKTALTHFWNKIVINKYLCLISEIIFMPAFLQSSKLICPLLTIHTRMVILEVSENQRVHSWAYYLAPPSLPSLFE